MNCFASCTAGKCTEVGHDCTSNITSCQQITPDSKLSVTKLPSPGSGDNKGKQKAKKLEVPRLENEKQLGALTLCLPVCRISESVQQLMELALHTLSEAVGSSSQWYALMLSTAHDDIILTLQLWPSVSLKFLVLRR